MNVAIIGCGYVGCAIAQHWRHELGLVVCATTTTPERVTSLEEVAQRVVVVKGDDPASLLSVVQDQECVLLSVGAKSANYEETYLHTAQTLVSVLKQAPTVRQLIYTGSYSVYGNRGGEVVDESSPVAPTNANGQILAQTEDVLLAAANNDLDVCILRLGGIYGPGRELIKLFRGVGGKTRPGDGSDVTNWIHLDDIVAAIEFVRAKRLKGIYNLVDGAHLSSRELLSKLFEKHHLPQVIWDATSKSDRPYNAWVDNQKIKAAGYQVIQPQMIF